MPGSAPWSIYFAAGALGDIAEIVQCLLENDGPEMAKELTALIRSDAKQRLMHWPLRGHPVPELQNIAAGYYEIHVKFYRIIYQPVAENRTVRILLVAHARRSIQDMLRNRLLPYTAPND